MSKEIIKINDFSLFFEIVNSINKMVDGVKCTINGFGLTICAKNDFSKCEITSNSVTSDNEVSFCIRDINVLTKVLTTLKNIYGDEIEQNVNLYYDKPSIKIESKKFKTKLNTIDEDSIKNFISTKVKTELTSQIEFTTNSSFIRSINNYSFITSDKNSTRIYIESNPDMENNVIFARVGNESNETENYAVMELGLITSGTMGDRKIILDFDRLNMLNILPSDEISVQIANERPVLISKVVKSGKNGSFLNINMYVFMMVK
jgi:hypothetical protein